MEKPPAQDTPLSTEICDYIGIIRDEEIRAAIERSLLLTKDTADPQRIRQASYELRLSDRVEYLVLQEQQNGKASAKYERPANGIGAILRIDPGQTVKVEVAEVFNLPTDVVAHVIPVGNIYKIGLCPETTYADPGFDGDFYIILSNFSPRVVELPVGEPIARVEFIRIARETKRPHPGSKSRREPAIWPRRIDRHSKDELQKQGIKTILDRLDQNDPPHCEHAYVARVVHENATSGGKTIEDLSERITKLEAIISGMRRRNTTALAIVLTLAILALSPWWWPLLPDIITSKVPEGIGKGMGSFLGGIVGALLTAAYTAFKNRK